MQNLETYKQSLSMENWKRNCSLRSQMGTKSTLNKRERVSEEITCHIQNECSIKRGDKIEDFIGCEIQREGDKVMLSQPALIKKSYHKVSTSREYGTPVAEGSRVLRKEMEDCKLSQKEQTEYRIGVDSLLYLLKHLRPDLPNSVRELSKSMKLTKK